MVIVILTGLSVITLTLSCSLLCRLFVDHEEMVLDHATWMMDDLEYIRYLPLNKIAIPGSHNSGSYAIGPNCKHPAGDCPRSLARYLRLPLISRIVTRWVKCQTLSIYEQLLGGVRYLDIRLSLDSESKQIYLCHGLRCITLSELTGQVAAFIDRYPSELILIDINHVYVDFKVQTRNPNDIEHGYIIDCILSLLGHQVIRRDYNPCSTIDALLGSQKRIILIYDHDHIAMKKNIWDKHWIYSHWVNSSDMRHIQGDGISRMLQRDSNKLHVLQLLLTLSESEIASRIASSILRQSRKLSAISPVFILDQCASNVKILEHFNIVIIDNCGYNEHAIVRAAREINRCKFILFNKLVNIADKSAISDLETDESFVKR